MSIDLKAPIYGKPINEILKGLHEIFDDISLLFVPDESVFVANDTSPSVADYQTDYVTANTATTNITTFDGGMAGQRLTVRVNDTHTTFLHGSGITTTTGASVAATNGRIYQFILRSSWIML